MEHYFAYGGCSSPVDFERAFLLEDDIVDDILAKGFCEV